MAGKNNKGISSMGIVKDKINDLVQNKAYELYTNRGSTGGNELGDWLEAEKLVKQELRRGRADE
jgi:hypothetical protein